MTHQTWYAIVGMLAIVVTLYALRDAHTHYLPDLFGLALALAAPRQGMAIGAVAILALIRHSWLAEGLSDGVPQWLLPVLLPGAAHMSISDDEAAAAEAAYKALISAPKATPELSEIPQPVAENRRELICLGETQALARLVAKKEVGLTVAVKVGALAKSGKKYQQRTKEIQDEVERLKNHYPPGSELKRFE